MGSSSAGTVETVTSKISQGVFASLQSVPRELGAGRSGQPGKELQTIFASRVKTRGVGGRQACIYGPTLPSSSLKDPGQVNSGSSSIKWT